MWNVTDVWQFVIVTCNIILNLNPKSKNKKIKRNENKWSLLSSILTLLSLQGFFSEETDFHFHQFLSNFLKYSFSNFLLCHLYNIFSIYFSNNSSLLKSYSSIKSNFFYFLTSVLILPSNSATTFLHFLGSLLALIYYFLL